MKKIIAMLLALVLVMGLFVGCNNEPATPTTDGKDPAPSTDGATEGTTTEGEPAEIETPLVIQWDQEKSTDMLEAPFICDYLSYHTPMMWDRMYCYDETYDKQTQFDEYFVEQLVTGWEYSNDNKTVTFHFRDDAVWSDGEPITAEDAYFTAMVYILCPESTAGQWDFPEIVGFNDLIEGKTDTLAGMKVVGNDLVFELAEGNANFRPNMYILPAHCFEGVAWEDITTADYWKNPVTSGPYKFVEASFPDYFKLTRRDDYYGEPAGIKNVTCLSFKAGGVDAAIASVISNESTITTRSVTSNGLLANQIINANPDCVPVIMAAEHQRSLTFSQGTRSDGKDKAALIGEDPTGRQAITLVIDEDTIGKYVNCVPAKVMSAPHNKYYNPNFEDARPSQDLDKAKEMLTEAGWNFDDTLDIFCYYTDQLSLDVLEIIKTDAAKIGLKVNIDAHGDDAAAAQALGNFDLIFHQAAGANIYPCNYIEGGLHKDWGSKWFGFDKPENEWLLKYTAMAEEAWEYDVADQKYYDLMHKMQAEMFEDCLTIPIYINSTVLVYNAAQVFIPETAFDKGDNKLDLHLWKMLK